MSGEEETKAAEPVAAPTDAPVAVPTDAPAASEGDAEPKDASAEVATEDSKEADVPAETKADATIAAAMTGVDAILEAEKVSAETDKETKDTETTPGGTTATASGEAGSTEAGEGGEGKKEDGAMLAASEIGAEVTAAAAAAAASLGNLDQATLLSSASEIAAAAVAAANAETKDGTKDTADTPTTPAPKKDDTEARTDSLDAVKTPGSSSVSLPVLTNPHPPPQTPHEHHLANRRLKDRQRYASMTPEQREQYNLKRRQQYHRQSEDSRKKRRERERVRYHSLSKEESEERNRRRASLERERYKRLSPQELAMRNAKRRERASVLRKAKKEAALSKGAPDEELAATAAAGVPAISNGTDVSVPVIATGTVQTEGEGVTETVAVPMELDEKGDDTDASKTAVEVAAATADVVMAAVSDVKEGGESTKEAVTEEAAPTDEAVEV